MQPWDSPVWRANLGMKPLTPDDPDEVVVGESVEQSDGFQFSTTFLRTLPAKYVTKFSDDNLLQVKKFMQELWRRIQMAVKRGEELNTTLDRVTNIPGFDQYGALVEAFLNRPNGLMALVGQVLEDNTSTPRHAWIGARSKNEKKPIGKKLAPDNVPIPPRSFVDSPSLRAQVGARMFGQGAVCEVVGRIEPLFEATVVCLLGRYWERMARRLKSAIPRSRKAGEDFHTVLQEIQQNVTPHSLRKATRLLVAWRKDAILTGEAQDSESIFTKEAMALEKLWEDIGYSKDADGKGKRVARCKTMSYLADDAEMAAAHEYYLQVYCPMLEVVASEFLESLRHADNLTQLELHQAIDLREDDCDVGVGRFASWTTSELWAYLGLPNASQFPFAEPGDGNSSTGEVQPKSKLPPTPQWHQLVGVVIMITSTFTAHVGELPRPTLLCDDVGLGKTFQIIGLICVLVHLHEQQCLKRELPPFAVDNQTPFFAGLKAVPNLPSLIVIPKTLSSQWRKEIEGFTQRGAFNIVIYSSDSEAKQRERFFGQDGTWAKALGPNNENARRTIVLAELTALGAEARNCLEDLPATQSRAQRLKTARGDKPKLRPGTNEKTTIFGQQFLVLAIDESHNLRNCNHNYQAVLRLSHNSTIRIGATATPIFTGPKDLAAQGRLLQHLPMIGAAGEELCVEMEQYERDRAKEWDPSLVQMSSFGAGQKAGSADSRVPIEGVSAAISKRNVDQYKALFIAQDSILRMRELLTPVMLRRTTRSKSVDGRPVLDLPPCLTVVAWSPLNDYETEAMVESNELLEQSRHRDKTPLLAFTSDFLLSQKNVTFHPEIVRLQRREKEENLPDGQLTSKMTADWNAENIESKASTRMLTVDRILEHHWNGGAKPPLYLRDGSRDLGAEDKLSFPVGANHRPKFLIYLMYGLHRELLTKLLTIRGRGYVEYHGGMDTEARGRAIRRFETDDNSRVMLISNVGTTGLNLTAASILIFVSGTWSGQEKRQIMGRLLRYGQKQSVLVFDLKAPGTVDEVLGNIAEGKTAMSDEFLSTNPQLFQGLFEAIAEEDSFSEEDDEEPQAGRLPTSRAPRRPLKAAFNTDEPAPDPQPTKRAKASKNTTKDTEQAKQSRKRKNKATDSPVEKKQKTTTGLEEASLEMAASDRHSVGESSSSQITGQLVAFDSDPKCTPKPKHRSRPRPKLRPSSEEESAQIPAPIQPLSNSSGKCHPKTSAFNYPLPSSSETLATTATPLLSPHKPAPAFVDPPSSGSVKEPHPPTVGRKTQEAHQPLAKLPPAQPLVVHSLDTLTKHPDAAQKEIQSLSPTKSATTPSLAKSRVVNTISDVDLGDQPSKSAGGYSKAELQLQIDLGFAPEGLKTRSESRIARAFNSPPKQSTTTDAVPLVHPIPVSPEACHASSAIIEDWGGDDSELDPDYIPPSSPTDSHSGDDDHRRTAHSVTDRPLLQRPLNDRKGASSTSKHNGAILTSFPSLGDVPSAPDAQLPPRSHTASFCDTTPGSTDPNPAAPLKPQSRAREVHGLPAIDLAKHRAPEKPVTETAGQKLEVPNDPPAALSYNRASPPPHPLALSTGPNDSIQGSFVRPFRSPQSTPGANSSPPLPPCTHPTISNPPKRKLQFAKPQIASSSSTNTSSSSALPSSQVYGSTEPLSSAKQKDPRPLATPATAPRSPKRHTSTIRFPVSRSSRD